jgi:hypothetical protein
MGTHSSTKSRTPSTTGHFGRKLMLLAAVAVAVAIAVVKMAG